MVGTIRRKPLLLASTKSLINSILPNSTIQSSPDEFIDLVAGILRFPKCFSAEIPPKIASFDDSSLVYLSVSSLKRLGLTSGSLVLIKNTYANVQRIGQVLALDPPLSKDELLSNGEVYTNSNSDIMLVFPSVTFPPSHHQSLDQNVAYLSPLLAFNVELQTSCLVSLLSHGKESLASLFDVIEGADTSGEGTNNCIVNLRLQPWLRMPRYASHLRISFVKIPECGTIESLRGKSSIETMDRQEMIDLALQDHFGTDRYLCKGDVFRVQINWNCNSTMCVSCRLKKKKEQRDLVYFKVVALDPPDESVLRVNSKKTALVLGGSTAGALPPDLLISEPMKIAPLQRSTIKALGSIIAPVLCPSVLSSKCRVAILLHGLAGSGKGTVVKYVSQRLGLHVVEYSCHTLMAASEKKSLSLLTEALSAAHSYSPAILLLRHFDVFRNWPSAEGAESDNAGITSEVASALRKYSQPLAMDGENFADENLNGGPLPKSNDLVRRSRVFLVAAIENTEGLPLAIRRCFTHELSLSPLSDEERAEVINESLQSISQFSANGELEHLVKDIAPLTSGFTPRDLRSLVADAAADLTIKHDLHNGSEETVENKYDSLNPVQSEPAQNISQSPGKDALLKALDRSKKRIGSALGAPKVPNVKWEDVGGLEDVKKAILDTVQLPLLHKELFSSGLRRRSGVLFYGPPGTGKTLLAKAVATECSLNFLSVKGPELINMYIGESEKNIRDIFKKARSARPCVIFFDELDALAPARGISGDSGGVMDRVVSQMLAEIDGLNDSSQDLFVIGASNRPDLIDPALLRPGRFDKLLYVGVNSDASYRERVLKALTRKFKLHEDVSLYSIAKRCPPNFTGADMYALCADAWFQAAKRMALSSESDSSSDKDDADSVIVEYDDFIKVLGDLSPSLSLTELRKYEMLRDQFGGASN
ncbi:hypothetical protein RND81_04G081200 [Saponaria officinalis]|uniref:Peroxisomal ATPase PEX6 n=1 Tax=Saponaria officinalis TaxID=3572 RepID=A0AAW1LFU5_SAPOF